MKTSYKSFLFNSKIISILLIVYCLLFAKIAISQEGENLGFNRIELPPSPQANALGEYGVFPVSMNTGTLNISIPIAMIKAGRLDLPVTLNYSTNGLRVAQEAGCVGLGWVLNTGGVITRTVRGKADENYGYLSHGNRIPNQQSVDADFANPAKREKTYSLINRNVKGLTDYEPDLFSFNFGNYSGTFYISQSGMAELFPPQDLIIEPIIDDNAIRYFVVTDNMGIKYYFGQYLSDTTNTAYETTVPMMSESGGNTEPSPYMSAWYLVKAIDPLTNNKVEYSYIKHSQVVGIPYTNSITYSSTETYQNDGPTLSGFHLTEPETVNSLTSTTDVLYASTIEWNGKFLNFYYSTTIPGSTLKLDSVVQGNGIDDTKKCVSFCYQPYNSSNTNTFRLKLDSVIIDNNASSGKKNYHFTYVNQSLPPKDSKSIDHWGYYNGANNTTLLPAVNIDGLNRNSIADRETNGNYSQADMIKTIVYPTGGRTSFDFEANTYLYKKTFNDVTKFTAYTDKAIDSTMFEGGDTLLLDSYFADTTKKYYSFTLYGKLDTILSIEPTSGYIKLLKDNTVVDSFQLSNENLTYDMDINNIDVENNSYSIVAWLENGLPGQNNTHPKIKGWMKYMYYNKSELNDTISIEAGGLRIKRITNFDPIANKTTFKEYDYLNSGYLTSVETPNYATEMSIWHPPCYHVNCPPQNDYYDLVVSISSSVHNSLGTVAYGKVREYQGKLNQNTGYTDNFFKIVKDNKVGGTPYLPVLNKSWERVIKNRVVTMAHTTNGYDTVKVTYLQYRIDSTKLAYIKGFKSARIMNIIMLEGVPMPYMFTGDQFRYDNYELETRKYQLKQTKTVDYTSSGKIYSITDYKYENPLQSNVTSTETLSSNGNIEKTVFKYPSSFLLSCYQPCLNIYKTEVANCNVELDDCFNDLNSCYSIHGECYGKFLKCSKEEKDWIKRHCHDININCESRANRNFKCLDNLNNCLTENGYYTCLDTADCQTSKCYDTAYTNYQTCKQNIWDCAYDKYEVETDTFLKAAYLMYLANAIDQPVETIKYVNGQLVEDIKYDYKIFNDNDTVPLLYSINTRFNSSDDSVREITYEKYKNKLPAQVNIRNSSLRNVYLWSPTSKKLVAFIKNAQADKVFYESFEENPAGVSFVNNGINMAKTGTKVLQGSSYTFPADTITPAPEIMMSYWYFDGTKWNFNEEDFATQINPPGGNCQYIDEIRVFPKGAEMTTYSYDGFGYLINAADQNGLSTYYEYDEAGRLIVVRDYNKNIIKHFEYNYGHE